MKFRDVLIAVVIIILFWHFLSIVVDSAFLPQPLKVVTTFYDELFHGILWEHFLVSLFRVMASIFLAIITAAPLGMILGQSKRLNKIISPFIYIIYPIPKIVFVPLFLLFFGIGDFPKILIIYILIFFQILVLVRDYAAGIRPELVYSVQSLGAGRRGLFRFVYLPGTLPAVLTALRQSIGVSVAILYVAELFATQRGLGYYISFQGNMMFNYPAMYAGIIALSIMGVSLYRFTYGLQKSLTPWIDFTE